METFRGVQELKIHNDFIMNRHQQTSTAGAAAAAAAAEQERIYFMSLTVTMTNCPLIQLTFHYIPDTLN